MRIKQQVRAILAEAVLEAAAPRQPMLQPCGQAASMASESAIDPLLAVAGECGGELFRSSRKAGEPYGPRAVTCGGDIPLTHQ